MIFTGTLNEFDLIDFIKFVSAMKKTTVLVINGKMPAKIFFREGLIKAVVVPEEFTNSHKPYLSSIKEGFFALEDANWDQVESAVAINDETNAYLLDLARYRENPPDLDLYSMDMSFELKPTSDVGKLTFTDFDWKVIALLTEQKRLGEMVDKLGVSVEKLQWVIYSLEKAGLVQRKRPKDGSAAKTQTSGIVSQLRNFLARIKPKW